MAHSVSAKKVISAVVFQNEDASNNIEQRGGISCVEVDITSYTNGGEVVPSAALGLNEVYNAIAQMEEADTYAVRACTVASDRKSVTVNVDTAGGGTEVAEATDVGRMAIMAWGEQLGSGTN